MTEHQRPRTQGARPRSLDNPGPRDHCSTSLLGSDRLGVPVSVLLGPQQPLITYTNCTQLGLVGFIKTWFSIPLQTISSGKQSWHSGSAIDVIPQIDLA